MTDLILAPAMLGGLAVLLGGVLGVAAEVFKVKKDERILKVTEALPGANCGGCGFAGCAAFAEAVVSGAAKTNGCPVGGAETAANVARIMGKKEEDFVRMNAKVLCGGTIDKAPMRYEYRGVVDCAAAARLGGGPKACSYGCMGMGTCVRACKFDAIRIIDGVAVVDPDKCTACGQCVLSCPKGIIKLVPTKNEHWVICSSKDKGAVVRKVCSVGCIGCRLCVKACEFDAIHVNDNLAEIDYSKCTECGECARVCPTKCIKVKEGVIAHV